jgi:hypothetical protein
VLAGGALLGPRTAGAGLPGGDITMLDNRFDPAVAVVAQGQSLEFTNFGQVVHDARDTTGAFIATDFLSPPDSQTVAPLPGAGEYRYYCTFHPEMVGRLRVPVRLTRAQAPAGAPVVVRWAAERAPAGMVFDVQRRRPGTVRFVDWRSGVRSASATWRPATGGQWAIRARVRQPGEVAASGWSPVRVLRVT